MLNNNMNLNNVEGMLNNNMNKIVKDAYKYQYKNITKDVKVEEEEVKENNKVKNAANTINKLAQTYGKAEVKACGIVAAVCGTGTAIYGTVKEGLIIGALAGTVVTAATAVALAPMALQGAAIVAATKVIDRKLNK